MLFRSVSKLSNDALVRQLRIKSKIFQNSLDEQPEPRKSSPKVPAPEYERLIARFRPFAQSSNALSQLHLILFNSESDMPLYAERSSNLLERLRQLKLRKTSVNNTKLKEKLRKRMFPRVVNRFLVSLLGIKLLSNLGIRIHHIPHELKPLNLTSSNYAKTEKKMMLPRVVTCFLDSCLSNVF